MKILKIILCWLLIAVFSNNLAFAENLKIGSKGAEVKKMQNALISRGYNVGRFQADGIFGKSTRDAVIKFQRDNRLQPDGIVGPATKRALGLNSVRSLRLGDSGADVKQLQLSLMFKGYLRQGSIDGNYGKETFEAVKSFQKNNNLNVDGIAGPATREKLSSPNVVCAHSGRMRDLGQGWKWRLDGAHPGVGKPHVHVENKKRKKFAEGVDGSPSHGGNLDGVPQWVKDKVRNDPEVQKEREKLSKFVSDNFNTVKCSLEDAIKNKRKTVVVAGVTIGVAALIAFFPEFAPALLFM